MGGEEQGRKRGGRLEVDRMGGVKRRGGGGEGI
jgi:hypothetical protein